MKHAQALALASKLVEAMRPFCERIEIAGSLRRGCPQVKDVEIVAIPRWELRKVTPLELFTQEIEVPFNALHDWALNQDLVRWIKPREAEAIDWPPKVDGRYWRGLLPQNVHLDLFLCAENNWGNIFLIRTGSAEFSHAVADHARKINRRFDKGRLHIGDIAVDAKEESDVFRILSLEYVEPENRIDWRDVRPIRGNG